MLPLLTLLSVLQRIATDGQITSFADVSNKSTDSLGVAGATAINIMNELKEKNYFTTEEAMCLLNISKPTILRKFKAWKTNPESKFGLAYEGKGGRSGFRVSRESIDSYAQSHGIKVNWERLAEYYLNKQEEETSKETGLSKEKLTLQKIELDQILKQKAELELEFLELEAEDEKDSEKLKALRKKVLETKMKITNIDYDIKILQMSLEKESNAI